ncbi:oxidoreductase [Thozetella sp. PMI_491]|nr:oxidoreductase [Thozetella sp. PMI_491]
MARIKSTFNPSRDIPDLSGRVFLITGGTSGLGLGVFENLAAHSPQHIFITGRNTAKGSETIKRVQTKFPGVPASFIECDLADLASVQVASQKVLASTSRLDILICNAGIMARPPTVTKDGYEEQFQVNHLGHALLIRLLLPTMLTIAAEPGADVRIISTTSKAYKETAANGIDFATLKTGQASIAPIGVVGAWRRYGQSKLANILYARSLAKKQPEILAMSVHPGYIPDTELNSGVGWFTMLPARIMSIGTDVALEDGSHTQLWAATAPRDRVVNGEFYEPFGVLGNKETAHVKNDALAERLWDWTEVALSGFK